jgi:hypothetical protein
MKAILVFACAALSLALGASCHPPSASCQATTDCRDARRADAATGADAIYCNDPCA